MTLLDHELKGKSRQAWLWALYSLAAGIWFHFSEGRGAADICEHLHGLHGIAQTDGYAAYETLFAEMNKAAQARSLAAGQPEAPPLIEHAGCWAHARRKFWDSSQIEQSTRADEVIVLIQKLYRIEKRVRGSPPEDVASSRQIESLPILQQIRDLLEAYHAAPSVLPKSKLGKAVDYTLGRWKALQVFTRHGHVHIDDNPVERGIRPAALGRKNCKRTSNPIYRAEVRIW